MATSAAVTKLLECPICLEIFKEPKTLICNHSFCKSCLADIVRSKYLRKDQTLYAPETLFIVCPTCKGNSQEFRSLDDIGTLHIINELLEAHTQDEGIEKYKEHPCSCARVATVVCCRCDSKYCSKCCTYQLKEHCPVKDERLSSFMRCTMKHFFVKIQQEQDVYICKDHSLALDLFCSKCCDPICTNCYLSKHRDHKTRPIKYGRDDAMHLIDVIQSTEHLNVLSYDQLHQEAIRMLECAKADDQRISELIEAQERKVLALISSLFTKARLVYSRNVAVKVKAAEEAISFCIKSMNKEEGYDFDKLNDFELASLMNDFISGMDRRQCESASIQEKTRFLEQYKFQRAFELCINENAIFRAILGIFDHFELEPQLCRTSIPCGFHFEDYSSGVYSDNTAEEEISDMDNKLSIRPRPMEVVGDVNVEEHSNVNHLSKSNFQEEVSTFDYKPSVKPRERISYSRDFLLSLQHCTVRPTFPEGLEDILSPLCSSERRRRELRKVHSELYLPVRDERTDSVEHWVLPRFLQFNMTAPGSRGFQRSSRR